MLPRVGTMIPKGNSSREQSPCPKPCRSIFSPSFVFFPCRPTVGSSVSASSKTLTTTGFTSPVPRSFAHPAVRKISAKSWKSSGASIPTEHARPIIGKALSSRPPSTRKRLPGTLETLRDHLDGLEKGKHAEIRKALKLKESQLEAILAFIKTLSPFPGRLFSTEKTRYVVPDLRIRIEENEFVIELNDEIIPVLGINPFFAEFSKGKGGKEAASFVKENIEKAKFFIGSIQQRNVTLVKVAKAIVKFQTKFFIEGPQAMQPLILRDVADEIGVHETTVSRIANGKYVQTEWGIFELRRFFTNSVPATASGTNRNSKESAKATLREILETEQRGGKTALSDREIVDILVKRGIKIARRTVAKYRGELDMDSSFGRRKR